MLSSLQSIDNAHNTRYNNNAANLELKNEITVYSLQQRRV